LFTLLGLLLPACVTHEELVNFNDGPEFPNSPTAMGKIPELKIQPDDILSIRVKTMDPMVSEQFNIVPENQNMNMAGGNASLMGHLVDKDGFIDFPILGQIEVAGMTTAQLRDKIAGRLVEGGHLVGPTVIVRFINFRVTVLGEVTGPGSYTMNDERVTVLDALGQAGDISPYGNRTNILLIREYDGEREYVRLNLQDRDVFQSPYFYLHQNDVIYVEPLGAATAQVRDQSQRILPWLSVISSLTTLVIALTSL